ncbi:MAG: ribonuclease J, partial [Anaerolineae bacterium]|nr:ribonuclease J [Anaerolineae bacterium]
MTERLRILPLGGLGEIGKNMMVVEYGNDAIIIDAGIMFPENDMLGIDYIIPDFHYLLERPNLNIRAIFITHGHEDHTGAIGHVAEHFPAPIYATRLTAALLEVKLKRYGSKEHAGQITEIKAGDILECGPFTVETYHVCHSIPDGVGLGITTPVGMIVHTGDFKFDPTPVDNWPTDFGTLAEFGKRGVLALFGDSTNADRPGWTASEAVIDAAFDRVFRSAKGRIIIGAFASSISRIQQVANAASRYGRKIAFTGTSMVENVKMTTKFGYLDLPPNMIVPIEQAQRMTPRDVVIMTTGTQGEPSSILSRLAQDRHRQLEIIEGDT